jgi:hypothetical protein
MKKIIILINLLLVTSFVNAEENVLFCEGKTNSYYNNEPPVHNMNVVITKQDGKPVKVVLTNKGDIYDKTPVKTYTLEKTDIKKYDSPFYLQLIVEESKIILRSEYPTRAINDSTADTISDTIIENTGSYTYNTFDRAGALVFSSPHATGQCVVRDKVF